MKQGSHQLQMHTVNSTMNSMPPSAAFWDEDEPPNRQLWTKEEESGQLDSGYID